MANITLAETRSLRIGDSVLYLPLKHRMSVNVINELNMLGFDLLWNYLKIRSSCGGMEI